MSLSGGWGSALSDYFKSEGVANFFLFRPPEPPFYSWAQDRAGRLHAVVDAAIEPALERHVVFLPSPRWINAAHAAQSAGSTDRPPANGEFSTVAIPEDRTPPGGEERGQTSAMVPPMDKLQTPLHRSAQLDVPPESECNDIYDAPIPCVYVPFQPGPRFLAVFFHGNGADVGMNVVDAAMYCSTMKADVLFVEYPGYGLTKKIAPLPNERHTLDVALSVMRFLLDSPIRFPGLNPDGIILLGQSMGTGVAMQVVLHRLRQGLKTCAAVILKSPYTSLRRVPTGVASEWGASLEQATARIAYFKVE